MSFGIETLPYGVFSRGGEAPRIGVAFEENVIDLAPALGDDVFRRQSLNAFMARGIDGWSDADGLTLHLPFEVADYVDFYSSRPHAENLGRMFRPGQEPLSPNWLHLPIGYHGRAGTVVVSGTDVERPCGQRVNSDRAAPEFGPSTRLDVEVEVGFVVGVGSSLGTAVPVDGFRDHVFGIVLMNDWSARDLQAYEYVPLGPFLAKSFATSISPWVIPIAALDDAWVSPPTRDPEPLPYLRGAADRGLDIDLELRLNGEVLSRPPFGEIYWTPAQQLAHMTINGASLRCGDLYGSGTVSGDEADQRGSLIELSWNGRDPIRLADGTTRAFLEDGDVVTISASAPGPAGSRVTLGEVSGTILPARC